jgi:hypothetical protein
MKPTDDTPTQISPTFCSVPWVHLFADELGVLRPCCMTMEQPQFVNRDPAGVPYTVDRPGGVEAAWNAPFMKELRLDMLNGRRPPVCRRCFANEDLGISSYRQDFNESFGDQAAAAIAQTTPDGASSPDLIRSVDLRLGNLCNLRCRMCSPISSKLLIPEFAEITGIPEDDKRLVRLDRLDWFTRKETWRQFERFLPYVERLHFAGGEPLLIPEMFDFLERAVTLGHAQNIKLSYNTNLTTLPAQVASLWPAFRQVKLIASLDGFGAVNSFIRFPARWESVHENLRRLDLEGPSLGSPRVSFNTTVQIYNILRLDELFEYLLAGFENLRPFPNLSLLAHPSCFSIQALPANLKREAAERLRAFVARHDASPQGRWEGERLSLFRQNLEGVLAHMIASDRSREVPEFLRRNAVHDRHRGQDLRTIIPELAGLYDRSI